MSRFAWLSLSFVILAGPMASGADVQPTDIFTATTRIDTRDWTTEPLALFAPEGVLAGDNELWVSEFDGDIWHIDTLTGAKTIVGNTETPGTIFGGRHIIARLGDHEIVVPCGESGVSEFSHVVFNLETGERRAFKNSDIGADLIGLPNGNLLGIGSGGLVIIDGQGQTLVQAGPAQSVRGFARHPDGRIIGIASASQGIGSLLVEINPETAAFSTFATLPGILPTRLAVGPDGTFYAVQRAGDTDFTIYRIDEQTFAISEIPLPPDDFRLARAFDLDVASDGKLLISVSDRRTRRSQQIGYPVILGINPETFETEIVVGGWSPTMTQPVFAAMGSDNAIYFTPKSTGVGDEHRVLRQDLKTGGITVVTNNTVEGAVLTRARAIAADGDNIYVINDSGNPDWEQLVHVDRLSGAQTMLGSFGGRLMVQQMMVDPADGSLLLAVFGATAESFRSILRVVPQVNPVFERINPEPFPGNPMFFDIAPDGSLVFYTSQSEGSFLYRVDRESGAWSRIGNRDLPPTYAGPFVVLDDGTIVARGFRDDRTRSVLETIDPVTGAATEVIDSPHAATLLTRMPRGAGGGSNRLSAATAAQSFGDGWYQSAWYGWFNEMGPWLLHLEHGWQFFGGGTPNSLFLYDGLLGTWIWTQAGMYPVLYAFPPVDDWLLYLPGGTADNRWFFSYGSDTWKNIQDFD